MLGISVFISFYDAVLLTPSAAEVSPFLKHDSASPEEMRAS